VIIVALALLIAYPTYQRVHVIAAELMTLKLSAERELLESLVHAAYGWRHAVTDAPVCY